MKIKVRGDTNPLLVKVRVDTNYFCSRKNFSVNYNVGILTPRGHESIKYTMP